MIIVLGESTTARDIQEQSRLAQSFQFPQPDSRRNFIERYQTVRRFSEQLCEPLVTEDYVIQSMPDTSPTKWHLAHVTWFWETFLLALEVPGYKSLHPDYAYLFNSYYNSLGARHSRPKRGLISRSTVQQTYDYRRYVDEQVLALLEKLDEERLAKLTPIFHAWLATLILSQRNTFCNKLPERVRVVGCLSVWI